MLYLFWRARYGRIFALVWRRQVGMDQGNEDMKRIAADSGRRLRYLNRSSTIT